MNNCCSKENLRDFFTNLGVACRPSEVENNPKLKLNLNYHVQMNFAITASDSECIGWKICGEYRSGNNDWNIKSIAIL